MKNIYNLMFVAVMLLFTACEESAVDDLTGKYPVPTEYALNQVVAQSMQKGETTRTFNLQLGASGNVLSASLVSSKLTYFLTEGVYSIADKSAAKAGNYVSGETQWNSTAVKDGVLTVKKAGDNYSISGTLLLADASIVKVAFNGAIVFPEDPPAFTCSIEVSAPYTWTPDGATFNEVEGSQLNKITVKSDGMTVAYFEIVGAANPASLSGSYPVSGEIRDANGALAQGSYLDLSAYVPGLIIEGGSYLLDGDTKQYISSGTLTIVDNGGTLTFTSSDFAVSVLGVPVDGVTSVNYVDATLGVTP